MKFALCLAFLISLVAAITAATFIGYFGNTEYPGKCVLIDLVLSAGEEAPMENVCGNMVCNSNSSVTFHTCDPNPKAKAGHKWGRFVNATAAYPECCRRRYVKIKT